MDTNDAEHLMMPFFPNDPYLAVQSLSRAMYDHEGFRLPDWIWEAVVQQYFTFLQIQKITMKQEHIREQLTSEDPFKMGTVPYNILQHFNLN